MKAKIIAGFILLSAVLTVWFIFQSNDSPDSTSNQLTPTGEEFSILGRDHVPNGTEVNDYNSNPPTSGSHYASPANWGIYDTSVPDEVLVHNLEHGGIWISYKDIDNETKVKLESIANIYNQAVILTPRSENDSAIAIASWGRLQKLDVFDKDLIENFIRANINNSPEQFANITRTEVMRDAQAPDATFTTLDGEQLNLSEFKGEKVMFWLFATWCPSCIAGAQVLEERNNQLGNLKIIALKTDGNAGFPGPTVEEFAQKNAPAMLSAENWLWGEASKEASKFYNPRDFPDIYFLIDEDGILRDIDTAPAATINKILEFAN